MAFLEYDKYINLVSESFIILTSDPDIVHSITPSLSKTGDQKDGR